MTRVWVSSYSASRIVSLSSSVITMTCSPGLIRPRFCLAIFSIYWPEV